MKHTIHNPFGDVCKTIGSLVTALVTRSYFYCFLSALLSMILLHFFFPISNPTAQAYVHTYLFVFLIMLAIPFLIGTVSKKKKRHPDITISDAADILSDTNKQIGNADNLEELLIIAATQMTKIFQKHIYAYTAENNNLAQTAVFPSGASINDLSAFNEKAAKLALKNNRPVGAGTEIFPTLPHLYIPVYDNCHTYGLIMIFIDSAPFKEEEKKILFSIVDVCTLALKNLHNSYEKEKASLLIQKQQYRIHLLQAISHDLRTPLTSISGNANNLLTKGDSFDEHTKLQIYTDIYDDSIWLISLVENILSITRMEETHVNLHASAELMDEIITEALSHLSRKRNEHEILVESTDDFILAKIDAKLIVQVLVNLIENAIKYTPAGSYIIISTKKENKKVIVKVKDNGPGIPDEAKPHIFDMFYSSAASSSDSRKSLGLGLCLCKSIINAHNGELSVQDNKPHGTIFTFTLPAEEVTLHE